MSERGYPSPAVEARYLALARDGALWCPVCSKPTRLTPTGRVSLTVFDRFRGHLLGHDVVEFVEAVETARASAGLAWRSATHALVGPEPPVDSDEYRALGAIRRARFDPATTPVGSPAGGDIAPGSPYGPVAGGSPADRRSGGRAGR